MEDRVQKRFYEIKVYDGTERLFSCQVPVGRIGERRLRDLLRALVVKHALLTPEEIVDSHLNRNTRGYRDLLEVRPARGARRFQLMCGNSVHAVVRVVQR